MNWLSELGAGLEHRRDRALYRQRRVLQSPQGVRISSGGRDLLSFCSNDYLGLAADPRLIEAFEKGARQWGVGSGAAHLISGHSAAHHAFEEELADFVGAPRALLFSTGYMANIGVMAGLLGRGDSVVQDRLNHASLIDGAHLSGARLKRYQHADVGSLRQQLQGAEGRVLIASDGVFSMDGDVAPIRELVQSAADSRAALMIDDAHGIGVMGPQGRGSVAAAGMTLDQVPIYMATLGKGLGVAGAFVAGSEALIETLIQQARSYVYTTAMPAALAEAGRVALRIAQEEQWRRDRLNELIARFRQGVARLGLSLMPSDSPIQPLLLGEAEAALRASARMEEAGLLVSAIRPPTVPEGGARLRITLSATHDDADVDRLLDLLSEVIA